MEGIVQKPKKERRTKLGIVSIKIVEDDDGREVFEVHILTIFFLFLFFFTLPLLTLICLFRCHCSFSFLFFEMKLTYSNEMKIHLKNIEITN
jgi:hypothetical protein